jgi:putative ABC transport system substrate-binding protein
MSTRRTFLIALGGAISAPLASFAQSQGKVRRIGFLWENTPGNNFAAFKRGMSELGYTEGKSYAIEHRSAQNDYARLPGLAAELVALKVDVIVSSGTPSAIAASKATREIPILITVTNDPVGIGLAAALSRPGGNVTGVAQGVAQDLFTERLDLLRQIVPGLRRVEFLYDPDHAGTVSGLRQFESDCSKLGLKPLRAPVRKAEDMAAAFNLLQADRVIE